MRYSRPLVAALLLGLSASMAIADTAAALKALDPDKDGTLVANELSGSLDEAALKAADPDADATLDPKEYAAVVEAKFKAANPDDDGTIDEKELSSPAGAELLKLIN